MTLENFIVKKIVCVMFLLYSYNVFSLQDEVKKYERYGDAFFHERDFFRAITFYKLALIDAAEDSQKYVFTKKIADSFFSAARYDNALSYYKLSEDFASHPKDKGELCSIIGTNYFLNKQYAFARERFALCLENYKNVIDTSSIYYYQGFAHFFDNEYEKAQTNFELVVHDHELSAPANAITKELREFRPKRKSRAFAALLSVVPGLGQLYTEHYTEAALAFGLNAFFGFLSYDYFRKSQEISEYGYMNFAIFTSAGLTLYSANIYGAALSAKRYNQAAEQRLKERIIEIHNTSSLGVTFLEAEKGN